MLFFKGLVDAQVLYSKYLYYPIYILGIWSIFFLMFDNVEADNVFKEKRNNNAILF